MTDQDEKCLTPPHATRETHRHQTNGNAERRRVHRELGRRSSVDDPLSSVVVQGPAGWDVESTLINYSISPDAELAMGATAALAITHPCRFVRRGHRKRCHPHTTSEAGWQNMWRSQLRSPAGVNSGRPPESSP